MGSPSFPSPPDNRPILKIEFVYTTETGWSILAVYWQYRESGGKLTGALYRDYVGPHRRGLASHPYGKILPGPCSV